MTRVVHAERHGSSIDVFVRPESPVDGFHPWVLIRDVPHDTALPEGCWPIAARDEALRRYRLLIPPIDETELRAIVERPCRVHWWGRDHDIAPRVIGKIFGDGRRLITVSPLATRPNYFVVRVDSAEDFEIRDIIDDIADAAEDEFGRFRRDEEEPEDHREFPICDWGYGTCWGERYTIEELRKDYT